MVGGGLPLVRPRPLLPQISKTCPAPVHFLALLFVPLAPPSRLSPTDNRRLAIFVIIAGSIPQIPRSNSVLIKLRSIVLVGSSI